MSDYDWIAQRFDKVDADNKDIKDELQVVKDKVVLHGVYWDIVKYCVVAGGGISGAIAAIFGWNHKP